MRNSRSTLIALAMLATASSASMAQQVNTSPMRRNDAEPPRDLYGSDAYTRTYTVDEIAYNERRRAERERDEWNKQVDARKAERNARRGIYR